MKPQNALFQLLLLTMAASASGQALPVAPEAQSVRPLNLTLSKTAAQDTHPAALTGGAQAVPASRLAGTVGGRVLEDDPVAGRLPYGAGYESRQQGSVSGGGGGRGAGGQGGRGRGR